MIINEIRAYYDEFVDHQPALFSPPAHNDQSHLPGKFSFLRFAVVLFPGAELQPGGSALHMEDILYAPGYLLM